MVIALNNPEIFKYLDMSTTHITQNDSELLGTDDPNQPLTVFEHEYGFNVLVSTFSEDFGSHTNILLDYGYSQNLINLLFLAESLGCQKLALDCDGTIYDELPQFDW